MRNLRGYVLVVIFSVVLLCSPYLMDLFCSMPGSDDGANQLVSSISSGYKPWISTCSIQVKSCSIPFLFLVQIAIGLSVFFALIFALRKYRRLED